MASIRAIVTVDDEHIAVLDDIVERLRERGMTVHDVLENTGIVTGSIEDVDAIRDVEGVSSVDVDRQISIPPPDEDIQ